MQRTLDRSLAVLGSARVRVGVRASARVSVRKERVRACTWRRSGGEWLDGGCRGGDLTSGAKRGGQQPSSARVGNQRVSPRGRSARSRPDRISTCMPRKRSFPHVRACSDLMTHVSSPETW
eukprot:6178103-Pleurochrysis_carterae.AAC.2